MKTPNIFILYLRSANAQNPATPYNMNFNIGSVLNQAPNLINFQNQAYCKIKLRYFSVKRTITQFTADDISTLLVSLNTPQPNGIRSVTIAAGEPSNVRTSNIIGTVPTGNTNSTYSNTEYDNDYIYIANPFMGDINIELLGQTYGPYDTLDATMPCEFVLEVCFDDNPANINDNSGKLNTKTISHNFSGQY
tara:strand:+ start:2339 stop:2914 length:576 start_codon:yes stop_codon:yes gene_type:complete